jgi:hypothetical protein
MTEDQLFDAIDPTLRSLGCTRNAGESFREPPLEVHCYYRRAVRISSLPILGRGSSVTAVVRQPLDVEFSEAGYRQLLKRLAAAASGRFPPWKGLVIGLTAVVLTPEPIGPNDDRALAALVGTPLSRFRAVLLGLIRINLGQEATAFAFREGPGGLFPEPHALADLVSERLRRYVPLLEI